VYTPTKPLGTAKDEGKGKGCQFVKHIVEYMPLMCFHH